MTIAVAVEIRNRPWRGYDDPGLPEGAWFAAGQSVGDASGGILNFQLRFKSAGEPRTNRFFNLEQLMVHLSTLTQDFEIRTLNMDDWPAAVTQDFRWIIEGIAGPSTATTTLLQQRLPVFLGRASTPGAIGALEVITANPTAANIAAFYAQGYWWGPRSVLAENGLRRPVDGLYGH
jgi:hypothetical protein